MKRLFSPALLLASALAATYAAADPVNVDITVRELELQVDNAGKKAPMWTFGGTIPGRWCG